ncbi:hypothetical protein GCM10009830_42970 [Glycomyces endophyticus]|uniref:Uncharacterized protein n=1 Tax=Glycomyces endophyticus TaxID=480996 RepID=A0ABP4TMD9_9ACTN
MSARFDEIPDACEEDTVMPCCPYCGWPDDDPVTTVSRHPGAVAATVWTRCICGSLQMRVQRGDALTVCARSRPSGRPAAAL